MAALSPEKHIEPDNLFTDCYTMFYKDSTNNMMKTKNFRCTGGLKQARARAEQHAKTMEYRLFHVQSLISNLSVEEDYYLGKETKLA